MAPMIDMVFLLLVFFMTVSTLAQDERHPLALPESERSEVPREILARGTISIEMLDAATAQLYLGARPVSRDDLRAALEEALATQPDLEVNVRAAREAPFREIREVLQLCAEAGAYKVVYATYQKS